MLLVNWIRVFFFLFFTFNAKILDVDDAIRLRVEKLDVFFLFFILFSKRKMGYIRPIKENKYPNPISSGKL